MVTIHMMGQNWSPGTAQAMGKNIRQAASIETKQRATGIRHVGVTVAAAGQTKGGYKESVRAPRLSRALNQSAGTKPTGIGISLGGIKDIGSLQNIKGQIRGQRDSLLNQAGAISQGGGGGEEGEGGGALGQLEGDRDLHESTALTEGEQSRKKKTVGRALTQHGQTNIKQGEKGLTAATNQINLGAGTQIPIGAALMSNPLTFPAGLAMMIEGIANVAEGTKEVPPNEQKLVKGAKQVGQGQGNTIQSKFHRVAQKMAAQEKESLDFAIEDFKQQMALQIQDSRQQGGNQQALADIGKLTNTEAQITNQISTLKNSTIGQPGIGQSSTGQPGIGQLGTRQNNNGFGDGQDSPGSSLNRGIGTKRNAFLFAQSKLFGKLGNNPNGSNRLFNNELANKNNTSGLGIRNQNGPDINNNLSGIQAGGNGFDNSFGNNSNLGGLGSENGFTNNFTRGLGGAGNLGIAPPGNNLGGSPLGGGFASHSLGGLPGNKQNGLALGGGLGLSSGPAHISGGASGGDKKLAA